MPTPFDRSKDQTLGRETRAIIEAINGLKRPAAHENLNYQIMTIDLAVARANVVYELQGWFDHLSVERLTGTAAIRINESTKDSIDLTYTKSLNTPIRRFYLTNVAQAEGETLILAIGGEASFETVPMRQGLSSIFRYIRYSEDGAVATFETSTSKTDTPALQLTTFRVTPDLKSGKINRIHYRLNPTNVATYTLRVWCNADADNYRSNLQMLYESPAAQADDTDYIEEDLDIPFNLTVVGIMYIGIEWTAAPGVTSGFVEVSGEKWS